MMKLSMIKRFLLILFISSASSSYAQDIENFTAYTNYNIQKGESLYKIAQNFDLSLDEILRSNPNITNPRFIYAGQKIILPTSHLLPEANHQGIVINLAEPRLYFFLNDQKFSFPISIGADEKTPTGKTKILDKRKNPTWTPPASIREENPNLPEVVPAGPNNPLGNYAVHLDASHNCKWQGIMIHGTNDPWSIGSKVSHGCIRLYPQDIEKLFGNVEVNTPVEIVNQPIKVSEVNDKIYIEVHLQETPDVVLESMGVGKLICKKIKECEKRIDWQKVDDAVIAGLGIPEQINRD